MPMAMQDFKSGQTSFHNMKVLTCVNAPINVMPPTHPNQAIVDQGGVLTNYKKNCPYSWADPATSEKMGGIL